VYFCSSINHTLNTILVGGDGSTLNAHLVLLDGIGTINSHFVISLVTVLDPQVEVFDVKVQVGEDELQYVTRITRIANLLSPQIEHITSGVQEKKCTLQPTCVRKYLFLDGIPDDSCHFITVHINYRLGDLDLLSSCIYMMGVNEIHHITT
jgi:hypothetical protein